MKISDDASEYWKATQTDKNRYGDDVAKAFAVMAGVRSTVIAAFDVLSRAEADSVNDAQAIVYTFNIVWGLLEQEHRALLAQVQRDDDGS